MRLSLTFAALMAPLSIATAVAAQPAPDAAAVAISKGVRIVSADGTRIGRVEYIRKGHDGSQSAAVIYNVKMVYIPLSTLSANGNVYVTALTRAELSKLK